MAAGALNFRAFVVAFFMPKAFAVFNAHDVKITGEKEVNKAAGGDEF